MTEQAGFPDSARGAGDQTLLIKGRVERVTYANPETGYAVLKVKPPRGARFTAVGHVAELANNAGLEGAEFQFSGAWTMSKYGRQFAFTRCRLVGSELLFFLSRVVKGIGEKMAGQLLERFGENELVRILEEEPDRLLAVKGIKEKRLALIMKSWHRHKSLRALSKYLAKAGAGITPNLLIRIYNHFENDAVKVVSDDPYRLTEVRGIGFKTADRLAMAMGMAPDSPNRIRAAVVHVLMSAAEQDGHCYLEEKGFVNAVTEVLTHEGSAPEESLVKGVLAPMVLEGKLVRGPSGQVGLASYCYMEHWLRDFFVQRSAGTARPVITPDLVDRFLESYEAQRGIRLSTEQRRIVGMVATEPRLVFGLAGFAGTGKTTVCRAILDLLVTHYAPKEQIACCAFTGMASARIRKATGYDSFTIHSLLKYQGGGVFEYGPEKPLPYRVVVLDEASMVSLPLFYRLANALKPSTLFILVGDPAQLPPIGAGNVFDDALNAGLVPSVHLTKIYRQSEDSVLTLFANEIRQGRVPPGVDKKGWKDFSFERLERHNIYVLKKGRSERELKTLREENNQGILDRILELARAYKTRLSHPVWDFQVLTPMRIGQLGTEVLNSKLQEILNPAGRSGAVKRAGMVLREGDKVVHLQNRDMPVMAWESFVKNGRRFDSPEHRRIFNGSVGLVAKVDHDLEQFYVVYPERIAVAYDFDHIGDILELAYALTVHKAQGSQYRVVVIPMTNSHFIMLNNKWFYTAITRAEKKVYIIGQPYAMKRACTNVQGVARNTWLSLTGYGQDVS